MRSVGFYGRLIATLTLVAVAVATATIVMSGAVFVRSRVDAAFDAAWLWGQSLRLHLQRALQQHTAVDLAEAVADPAFRTEADALVGYSPFNLYVAVIDAGDVAVFHSVPDRQGRAIESVESLHDFSRTSRLIQMVRLARSDAALAVELPLSAEGPTAARVRIAVSAVLLRRDVFGAIAVQTLGAALVVLAAFLGSLFLANRLIGPIARLRFELSRLDVGEGRPRLDLRRGEDVDRIVEFFASVGRQISEQKATAEVSRRRLDNILGGLKDAVLSVDGDRRIVAANAPACRLLGTQRAEVEGRLLDDLVDARHPLRRIVEEVLQHKRTVASRPESLEVSSQSKRYLVSAELAGEGDRGPVVIAIARDVDELSRLGDRVGPSRKIEALGQLAAAVAHQLRNPLNGIVLSAAGLRERLAVEDRGLIDALEADVHRADGVIQSFLKLARTTAGEMEGVAIDGLVRDVVEQWRPQAEATGVAIEPEIEPDLPWVRASPTLLSEAMANLIANAIEASTGGTSVRLTAARQAAGGVTIAVHDAGPGIPAAVLPRIFEAYFTTKESGTGIGLPLVRQIAALHGGSVTVDSVEGRGTTVTISLPELHA